MNRTFRIGFAAAAFAVAVVPALAALRTSTVSAQMPPAIPTLYYGEAPGTSHGQEVIAFIGDVACGSGNVVVTDGVPNYVINVVTDSQIPGCGLSGRQIRFYFPSITGAAFTSTTQVPWQAAGAPRNVDLTLSAPLTQHNVAAMTAKEGTW